MIEVSDDEHKPKNIVLNHFSASKVLVLEEAEHRFDIEKDLHG